MAISCRISSDYKTSGQITDFIHNCDSVMNVRKFTVRQVLFPNLFDNIRTGDNDTLDYTINGVPSSLIIPSGFYSVSELTTYLNANIAGATFAYNSLTKVIDVTNTSGFTLVLLDTSTIKKNLGYINDVTILDTVTQGLPYDPNLYNYTHVFLTSNKLSGVQNMMAENHRRIPVFAVIPIDVPYGEIVNFRPYIEDIDSIYYPARDNISEIDVQMRDKEGNIVLLPENHNIEIILHLEPT